MSWNTSESCRGFGLESLEHFLEKQTLRFMVAVENLMLAALFASQLSIIQRLQRLLCEIVWIRLRIIKDIFGYNTNGYLACL